MSESKKLQDEKKKALLKRLKLKEEYRIRRDTVKIKKMEENDIILSQEARIKEFATYIEKPLLKVFTSICNLRVHLIFVKLYVYFKYPISQTCTFEEFEKAQQNRWSLIIKNDRAYQRFFRRLRKLKNDQLYPILYSRILQRYIVGPVISVFYFSTLIPNYFNDLIIWLNSFVRLILPIDLVVFFTFLKLHLIDFMELSIVSYYLREIIACFRADLSLVSKFAGFLQIFFYYM